MKSQYFLFPSTLLSYFGVATSNYHDQQQTTFTQQVTDIKVPVQLGVMSRCPDAMLCEAIFDKVMSKVGGKMDLSLIYVAKIDDSQPDFGVSCMHGPDECAGNVQQLCVDKYAPSVSHWWEFVKCQNFQGRNEIGLPDVALTCADATEIDWETSEVGQCAGIDGSGKGLEGVNLLKDSVSLGQKLNITKSCTVIIASRVVCIHDGHWMGCQNGHTINDFVRQIDEEYDNLNG